MCLKQIQPHPCSCSSEFFFDRGPMTASGCLERSGSWTTRCGPPCHLQRHHPIRNKVIFGRLILVLVWDGGIASILSRKTYGFHCKFSWCLMIAHTTSIAIWQRKISLLEPCYHEWTFGSRHGNMEKHAPLSWKKYDYTWALMLVNSFRFQRLKRVLLRIGWAHDELHLLSYTLLQMSRNREVSLCNTFPRTRKFHFTTSFPEHGFTLLQVSHNTEVSPFCKVFQNAVSLYYKFPRTRKFHCKFPGARKFLFIYTASFPEHGSFSSLQASQPRTRSFSSQPKDLAKWIGLSRISKEWQLLWGWVCLCQFLKFWQLQSGAVETWYSWRTQWLLRRLRTLCLTILGSFRLSSSSGIASQASSSSPTACSTWTRPTTTGCSFQLRKGLPKLA